MHWTDDCSLKRMNYIYFFYFLKSKKKFDITMYLSFVIESCYRYKETLQIFYYFNRQKRNFQLDKKSDNQ